MQPWRPISPLRGLPLRIRGQNPPFLRGKKSRSAEGFSEADPRAGSPPEIVFEGVPALRDRNDGLVPGIKFDRIPGVLREAAVSHLVLDATGLLPVLLPVGDRKIERPNVVGRVSAESGPKNKIKMQQAIRAGAGDGHKHAVTPSG